MKIELLQEWLGNKKGAVVDLIDRAAQDLIWRKIARPYKATFRKKNVGKTHS